jgi:hypothetical protein
MSSLSAPVANKIVPVAPLFQWLSRLTNRFDLLTIMMHNDGFRSHPETKRLSATALNAYSNAFASSRLRLLRELL